MFELENKKVIITGATGGIGNAITDFFCKQKSSILATGTNQQKLDLLKEKYNKINIKILIFQSMIISKILSTKFQIYLVVDLIS